MPNCPHCDHELTKHEIGSLYANLGGRSVSSFTDKDITKIRKSNAPIKKLAEKYQVSFATIWRIKNNKTWTTSMNCPHCDHKLANHEIGKLFASLGGSTKSPAKTRRSVAAGRAHSTLTWDDVIYIRKSKLSIRELADKYNVNFNTIWKIRKNLSWKIPP